MDEAGAVDQHVDGADLLLRRGDRGEIQHVQAARRHVGGLQRAQHLHVDVGGDDIRPLGGEPLRVARPMPCAAAVTRIFLPFKRPLMLGSVLFLGQRSSPRCARFAIRAPVPKVQGATSPQCFTRLVSAPSFGVAMVTMSPTLWVKPCPLASRSLIGANMVPQNSMKPSGYW